MTRDISVTDTEFLGAVKTRFVEIDITNYDDDTSGDGEAFAPSDIGMNRFQNVQAEVMHGEGGANTVVNCVAQYDYANNAVRLLVQTDNSGADANTELVELAGNNNEGAKVKLTCMGR